METRFNRLVRLAVGALFLAVAVAGFAGWPRTFKPEQGWFLLFFALLGVDELVRAWMGRQSASVTISVVVVGVMLLVLWSTEAAWIF